MHSHTRLVTHVLWIVEEFYEELTELLLLANGRSVFEVEGEVHKRVATWVQVNRLERKGLPDKTLIAGDMLTGGEHRIVGAIF